MADKFFPTNFDTAPVMPVEAKLYTIRATMLNPETGIDMPAPDHVWLLVDASSPKPQAVAKSTPSDSTGTTALGAPAPIARGRFSLLFFPAPDPAKTSAPDAELVRSGYRQEREAWIDLDQPDRWAVPPTPATFELRRLFRVPLWSSARKAALGGFKVSPPNTSIFSRQGIILGTELAEFGPWDMPLDFNWARAKVEFSFIDWQQNKFETLPPGLIVEVRRTLKSTGKSERVAAGVTAALPTSAPVAGGPPDRGAFLLLEGDKTMWKECHIQFSTPGACFVDLSSKSTPSPDNRIKTGQPPQSLDDFNPLPLDWHSFKMRASFTTTPRPTGSSPPAPPGPTSPRGPDKIWDGLRFDIAQAANGDNATISFNIDDIVICDQAASPLTKNLTAPVTLLDHLLSIIDPDSANFPYQSLTKRVGLLLRAPDALTPVTPGSPNASTRAKSTRLVHFDGGLHDVRNDRVTVAAGALGVIPCIGARAAVRSKHQNRVVANPLASPFTATNLRLEMHLIDVPEVNDPVTNVPLLHLLFFLPVKVRVDAPLAGGSTLKDARQLLNAASERWSPGHPGVSPINSAPSGSPPTNTKRYALVPTDPTKRNLSIIRFRTFFAETAQSKPSLIVAHARETTGLRPATTDGTSVAATRIQSFDTSVSRDISGTAGAGPSGDEGDKLKGARVELTHEFGHGAFGLNDEYVEFLDTVTAFNIGNNDPELPTFTQFNQGATDYRPYYSDLFSMMRANHVPRLRHFWHHAQILARQFQLPQAPYDLVHENFNSRPGINPDGSSDPGSSLTYSVPPRNSRTPWTPLFFNVKIPGGFGEVALFAIGDDEGTVESMFKVQNRAPLGLAKQDRMHAVLVVRSKICFILDRAMSTQEKLDTLHKDFQAKIYDDKYALLIRFVLATTLKATPPAQFGSVSGFDRIAVLFHPLYSISSSDIARADVVFNISKTANPPRANPFQGKITAKQVNIMAADFNFEDAWRLVLGVQNAAPGVIRTTDLDPVARLVEAQLSEPANSRQPGIFS